MSTLNGGPGNIVTNGLIIYLDAANYQSYISGSTTWYDLSGNNYSGSLINGPTYDANNGGSIVFDGTNDYVSAAYPSTTYTNLTFCAWINRSTLVSPGAGIIFNRGTGSVTGMSISYPNAASGLGYHWNNDSYNYNPNLPIPINTWCYCSVSVSPTSTILQVNQNTVTRVYTNITASTTIGASLMIGADISQSRYYPVKIATAQIYNRSLTLSEMLQNYNAQKTRFGIS